MAGHKLRIKVYYHEQATYIKIVGIIDEDNHLSALLNQYLSGELIIDCSEVERINSYGARDWMTWVGSVADPEQLMVLVGCSPAVISLVNLCANFVGPGIIRSFYAPYFCLECSAEKRVLLAVEEVGPDLVPPHKRCDECEQVLEFDDMPEAYFSFIKGLLPAPPLEHIDHLLTVLRSGDAMPALVRRRANTSGIWHYSVPSLPRAWQPAMGPGEAQENRSSADPSIIVMAEGNAKADEKTSLGFRPTESVPLSGKEDNDARPLGLRDTVPLPLVAPQEVVSRETPPVVWDLPPPMADALPRPAPATGKRWPYVLVVALLIALLVLAALL